MQPLRALVSPATRLIISPEGSLNLIPFEALVDEQQRYLVESYSISYVTGGRDLLRMQVAPASNNRPVVVADPLFGDAPIARANPASATGTKAPVRRQSVTAGENLSDVYFAPLAGTEQEARAIRSLFPDADVLTRSLATEGAVKRVDAPRILHIATHGFFLHSAQVEDSQAKIARVNGTRAISSNAKIENPLLRSGLALAGANSRTKSGEDGILTALEASSLDLWGTKLVTLSACDTGLGAVKSGEGVYGLRRAFVLAGAESLVMSLWPVSDVVTRELMTAYYAGLKRGLGRGEALRQVQLSMMKRQGRQHPFYWASFIQSGEWANLEGTR
jgi:CHAT domain-containing protein